MARRREFLTGAGAATLVVPLADTAHAAPALRPFALPFTSVVPLKGANGIEYELYVRVPPDYAKGTARYPVVWTLDADYSFPVCGPHLEHLADRMHIPAHILVSIAYPRVYPDMERYRGERTRDYTPLYFPTGGYGPVYQERSGGGPKFLKMIADQAIPMIDRLFRTDPARRTLCGHSYGGLFAAWVLQERPALFDRYLIVSPSLWYADKWLLAREERKEFKPLPGETRVWMGIGWWEEQAAGGMVTDMKRLAELLAERGDAKLIVEHKVFGDETHASIFPAAFSTGMRHLYPVDWLQAALADPAKRGEGCPNP